MPSERSAVARRNITYWLVDTIMFFVGPVTDVCTTCSSPRRLCVSLTPTPTLELSSPGCSSTNNSNNNIEAPVQFNQDGAARDESELLPSERSAAARRDYQVVLGRHYLSCGGSFTDIYCSSSSFCRQHKPSHYAQTRRERERLRATARQERERLRRAIRGAAARDSSTGEATAAGRGWTRRQNVQVSALVESNAQIRPSTCELVCVSSELLPSERSAAARRDYQVVLGRHYLSCGGSFTDIYCSSSSFCRQHKPSHYAQTRRERERLRATARQERERLRRAIRGAAARDSSTGEATAAGRGWTRRQNVQVTALVESNAQIRPSACELVCVSCHVVFWTLS